MLLNPGKSFSENIASEENNSHLPSSFLLILCFTFLLIKKKIE
jgi:hypothetical protein